MNLNQDLNQETPGLAPACRIHIAPAEPAAAQGVWPPLDARLFQRRIERMAELACTIDHMKVYLDDPEQRARLVAAVDAIHGVAAHYSDARGMGLYGPGDEDSATGGAA